MKKTTLNWFDRLMLSVTFAEAGVRGPGRHNDEQPANRNNACSQEKEKLFRPGQDGAVPTLG